MPDSYYRNCRTCGRRIQMRRMPGGQWLAFEGFDTIHSCQSPPARSARSPPVSSSASRQPAQPDGTIYDDLEFADFGMRTPQQVQEQPTAAPQPASRSPSTPIRPSTSNATIQRATYSPTARPTTSAPARATGRKSGAKVVGTIIWYLILGAVGLLLLGWCTGYADMFYDQRFGDEQETGGYCWDSGDPHPHYLGKKVATDHPCTKEDLAEAARQRFERTANVKPYRNDLSIDTVTQRVKATVPARSVKGNVTCTVREIKGSTAHVNCAANGSWYVTRQGNVFAADDAARSMAGLKPK